MSAEPGARTPTTGAVPAGVAAGTAAMAMVGSSAAVLAVLDRYPTFGGQAIRYAGATVALLAATKALRLRLVRPNATELRRLVLLACTGLAGFNVCFMQAVRHADPSTVGAIVGGVPVVLAVVGAFAAGRLPRGNVVAAAAVITAGVGLTQGFGGGTPSGLAWAAGALAAEVAFSVLAVPLLPRLGPVGVSTWASALAVPVLLVAGGLADGTAAVRVPTAVEAGALAYLAVVVTAAAFLLWYTAIDRLGVDKAGLYAGVAPLSAVAAAALLRSGEPTVVDLVGCVVVAAGVVYGTASHERGTRGTERDGADGEPLLAGAGT